MSPNATPGGGVAVRAVAAERRPAHLPRRSWYRAFLTCLALTACNQGPVEPQTASLFDLALLEAADVLVLSGDGQVAVVASRLPGPIVVQVLDADGGGIPFAPVTWTFGSGRGTGSGDSSFGTTVTLTADELGIVVAEWELGTRAGPQMAWVEVGTTSSVTEEDVASASGLALGGRVRLDATGTPAEAVEIVLSQTTLTMEVGETATLTATVVDQYGNEIPDAVITWTSSDPSIVDVQSPTAAAPSLSFVMAPDVGEPSGNRRGD
jgi:hypothetical protein